MQGCGPDGACVRCKTWCEWRVEFKPLLEPEIGSSECHATTHATGSRYIKQQQQIIRTHGSCSIIHIHSTHLCSVTFCICCSAFCSFQTSRLNLTTWPALSTSRLCLLLCRWMGTSAFAFLWRPWLMIQMQVGNLNRRYIVLHVTCGINCSLTPTLRCSGCGKLLA